MNRLMPKLLATSLLASSLLAIALPSAAQGYAGGPPQNDHGPSGYGAPNTGQGYGPTPTPSAGPGYGPGPSVGPGSYGQPNSYGGFGGDRDGGGFVRQDDARGQIDHLFASVRRGTESGAISPWQARELYAQIGDIRRLEIFYRHNDGYLNGRERFDLQNRVQRVEFRLHSFHDRPYGGGPDRGPGYGPRPGYGYDSPRDNGGGYGPDQGYGYPPNHGH